MRTEAIVAGVGMTNFGRHLDEGLKAIGGQAVTAALADAGITGADLDAAYVGNAAAGLITGQESIRGQVVLRGIGLGKLPVINVENACASASTAVHQAAAMVTAGLYDCVLALGVEKLYHEDKKRSFGAFSGAVDVEQLQEFMAGLERRADSAAKGAGQKRSMFMDIYAAVARNHMDRYGTTVEQFASISAKNSRHGHLNSRAQFREELTVEDVLAAPMIAEPLTRPMCSPIGDGAAALILVSPEGARRLGIDNPVRIRSSVLHSGWDRTPGEDDVARLCAAEAYEEAGIGPEDLSLVECHDASAPAELIAYEALGLCPTGEGGRLVDTGDTAIGGLIPVNTSGGLLRKGHPVGATGIAQIVELTEQIQGRSGDRQVEGATVGLAHNGGGTIGTDAAAMCVTIVSA
ncbi:MAG: thiolase family protein [Acidimicrobiales bacterium]|jgi:acetyl-CoA acetyltransferase|nr:thiolase family protein [Acidimicrobiales bacterium]